MKPVVLLFILFFSGGLYAQTYSEWIEFSFQYVDENRLDSAETALQNALRTEPDNPLNAFLFHNLGTIQRRLNKNKEAFDSYSLALRRHPDQPVFLADRASLLSEMKQFQAAAIDYNALLEIDPNNPEYLYQHGMTCLELKNYEQAEVDFKKMLENNPMNLYARLGLAALYKVQSRYDEAETIYNYLESKEPNLSDIYAGRAEIYLLREKGGRALSEINKAIQLSEKENPYFYMIRSRAKQLLLEKESAAEDVKKAIELGYQQCE